MGNKNIHNFMLIFFNTFLDLCLVTVDLTKGQADCEEPDQTVSPRSMSVTVCYL